MDYGANGYLGVHSVGKFTSYTEDPLGNAVQSVNSSYTLSSPQYPMGAFGTLGGTAYPSGYYGLQHNFNVGWNQSTGLLGLGARLYDPQTGRFINRDPMGYGGGMNLYGYADDDPVDGFDPTGTETFSQWYYGGMGGASEALDNSPFFGGATAAIGQAAGDYDSGCGSAAAVAEAGANWLLRAAAVASISGFMRAGAVDVAEAGASRMTTVIGKMEDLKQFDDTPGIDTWWKSGRIPGEGDAPVSWQENQAWLDERIQRGDNFVLATPENELGTSYVKGTPNGFFTFRELRYLRNSGIEPFHGY